MKPAGHRADATCVMHVDMDAFFAAVALRDRPELHEVPVAVGGEGNRGVVMAANYPARQLGVASGIPMGRARRLCPGLVVVPLDHDETTRVSAAVMEILRGTAPIVEVASVDEAYLDISRLVRAGARPRALAERIRAMIRDEQHVTASVGIASGRRLAKIASRYAKPDGVLEVAPADTLTFLHRLPVDDLPGVGERTGARLHELGLHTIGTLAHTPRATVCRALGPQVGASLHDLAWGIDPEPVVAGRGEEGISMGADATFARDVDDPEVIRRELLRLSGKVTARMRAAGVAGRTVVLRVRFADRTTISRSRTLGDDTAVAREVYAAAVAAYTKLGLQRARIRLVGVRVEGLVPSARARRQLRLGARDHGWEEADAAIDAASAKFGSGAVRPAALIGGRPGHDYDQGP